MDTPLASDSPSRATRTQQTMPGASSPVQIDMVFRVWSSTPKDTADPNPSAHHPGLLALIEDIASAKEGTLQTRDHQIFVTGIAHPHDALVIARQIQLGMQGFRARGATQSLALSIAMDTSARPEPNRTARDTTKTSHADKSDLASSDLNPAKPTHELITLLKLAKPAQILLTHDLCQLAPAVKALPVRSFPSRFGVSEYLWTSEEKLELLQAEPHLTLAAIPSSPAPAPANKVPEIPPSIAATHAASNPGITVPRFQKSGRTLQDRWLAFRTGWTSSYRNLRENPSSIHWGRDSIFIASGAVLLALLLFAAIGLKHSVFPSKAKAIAEHPATPSTLQSTPTSSTASAATPQPNIPIKVPVKQSPGKQGEPITQRKQPQESSRRPAEDCPSPTQISRDLRLAKKAREDGDYDTAIRRFNEILACDPINLEAREGLSRATQALRQKRQ